MSTRHLIKKNKSKKGISPVVATVILVAVAVVIAAALAGFAGSLFGSYSQGPQIKVKSMTVDSSVPDGTLSLTNSGNQGDAITSISMNGYTIDNIQNANGDTKIAANTDSLPFTFDITANAGSPALVAGQQVSATVVMQSGAQITQTLTVS